MKFLCCVHSFVPLIQQPVSDVGVVARAGLTDARDLWADTPLQPFGPILNRWFTEDLDRVCGLIRAMDRIVFDDVLEQLAIRYRCAPEDLRRIPAAGPVIVVANHAFGLADPLILGAMLAGVREDVCFTVFSTLFNLHAMREGVLLAGAESCSLWEDLQALPRVVISFLTPARKPRG